MGRRPSVEEVVNLVATGPNEAESISRATSVVVSELFRGAQKSVIVAGYAVRQGHKVFKDLADRMAEHPKLRVRLCLDIQRNPSDTSMPDELIRRFSERFRAAQWPLQRPVPEVYYDPRSVAIDRANAGALHAKCVVVDTQRLFISSANFTEAAQERNIELGLLLDSSFLSGRVTDFFEQLIRRNFLKRAF
jgi:phosphatidylserine/phosphatidylglycerophosphate/cardiolipin synthase-like enzyme